MEIERVFETYGTTPPDTETTPLYLFSEQEVPEDEIDEDDTFEVRTSSEPEDEDVTETGLVDVAGIAHPYRSGDGRRQLRTLEDYISVGAYEIYNFGSILDDEKHDYYFTMWFTLDDPPLKRVYKDVDLELAFADGQVLTNDLAPHETSEVKSDLKLWLTPRLKFSGVEAEVGGVEWLIPIKRIVPEITTYYGGEPRARWRHMNQNGIEEGCKWAFMTLSAPKGLDKAITTLEATVDYTRGLFWPRRSDLPSGEGTFHIDLPAVGKSTYKRIQFLSEE